MDKERQGRPFSARGVKGFVLLALWLMLAAPGCANELVKYLAWDDKVNKLVEQSGVTNYTVVGENTNKWEPTAPATEAWYVVNSNVTIGGRITVNGTVHLILGDGATLTAKAGITVEGGNTLKIYAQSEGGNMGTLYAGTNVNNESTCDSDAAGIGGGFDGNGGTVTIHGGVVTATGGGRSGLPGGAGIGGGFDGNGGTVTIHGGVVMATGGWGAAGIGGGYYGHGGPVTIHGGRVTATGGEYAAGIDGVGAGIGGGFYGNGGPVTIHGGRVTATGGKYGGAGIGGGQGGGQGGEVTITGGTVTATGGEDGGAGIGGGLAGNGGKVTITGGRVTATGGSSAVGIGHGSGNGRNVDGELTVGPGVRLYGSDKENEQAQLLEKKTVEQGYPSDGSRPQYMTATTGVLVNNLDELNGTQGELKKNRNDDIVITDTIKISGNTDIDGQGRTISGLGKGNCRVFSISGDNKVTVNISNLNITGGNITGNGGGVYVKDVTVNLDNCSIYGNTAAGNNDTTGCGGGLYVNNATVNMTHCSIYGNTARVIGNPQSGLAGYGGGVYANNATVNMTHCSLYGNAANGNCGGGVRAYGASTLNMINCTVTGNKTEGGGNGGGVYAGDYNAGTYPTVNMVNCTLANNTSKNNSGVIVDGSEISAATLNAVNTVFWNETDTKTYVSCNVDGPNFSLNLYNCAYGPDAITGNAIKSDDKCFKVSNWSNTPEDVEVEGVKHRVFPLTKGDQLIGRGLTSGDVVSALNLTSATNPTAAFVTDALSKDQVGHTRNRVPDIGAWEYVNVEGVTLNKTELNLTVDGSETLTATVSPTDAVSKDVTWSTSSADVVSVDQTGKVKALKDGGPVTITARSVEDDTISASCQVTVTAESNGGGNGEEEGGGGSNNNSNNNNGNNNNNNSNNNGGGSGGNGEEEDGGGSGGNGGGSNGEEEGGGGSGGNGGEEKPTPEKAAESLVPRLDLGSEAVINLIKALFGDGGEINIVVLSTDVAAISGGRNVEDLVKALKPEELAEISNDHSVILAILPEITPNQTAVFVLGVSFDIMPEGTLKWHGYPRLAENSVALAADESEGEGKCLFLDDDGQETKTAPTNGHVNAAVELTKGYTYAPVITAETSAGPTSDKGSGGGCNAGLGGAILAMFTFAARQLGSRKPTGLRRRVGRPCRSEA